MARICQAAPGEPDPPHKVMTVRLLPLLIFLIPAVAANVAVEISQHLGLVPACNVYLQGCTSISAAGRREPAIFLFRGTLIPLAVLLALFWHITRLWLEALGERSRLRLRAMEFSGLVSALFLILYVVHLGSEGETYRLMRRYGVSVFFAFSFLAQVLTSGSLWMRARAGAPVPSPRLCTALVAWCALVLACGLASLPFAEWALDRSAANNIVEWNLAGLMMGWFILVQFAWWQTRVRVSVSAGR